jgi:hypothetical protein
VKRIGPVDIAVVVVLLLAVAMPPREVVATAAIKGDNASTFPLALAEARTIAQPTDGGARADFARKLDDIKQNDWAIEDAARGAAIATPATAWRAWLAVSVGYVDRLDAAMAFELVQKALKVCDPSTCPPWERARMEIYRDHLDAGLRAGIDPKRDPEGFRRAGERGLHAAHISGYDYQAEPRHATGSAGSASTP